MEILIVEDDFISRSMLKKVMLEMGHQVMETQNGRQAWELVQKKTIRLIISDWVMPEMDGLELCRNIRKKSFDHYVYLIMLTGKDRKNDLVEVFQSGADDFIPKPFDPDELKARLLTGLRVIDLEERHIRMQQVLLENHEQLRIVNRRLLETTAQMEAKNERLETALKRLETTKTQMLQSEKMASIGQLAAGVAHEINNPTGFVSSNLKSLSDYQKDMALLIGKYRDLLDCLQARPENDLRILHEIKERVDGLKSFEQQIDIDYLLADTVDLINDCREGTDRIKKIVMDLKDFAHPGDDRIQSTDINKGLESTLNVVHNELKYKASVVKDFAAIPLVRGYPQQLNQVFMNILVNAAHAIEKKGEITVKTRAEDGNVVISITDTGCGIPEENISKIFDPFFTTKDVGKGTGLGMNIAYNIVQKHKGSIEVNSQIGKGTTMTVRIPAEPQGQDDEAS
ncbi:MAG: hybrid sensor histidine kinase/response regulator [Desulfobacteraceae bacterium]|nr:MAG: hybrid sensor histidine kinase/response regulator [Desulfobacteraceae bacterium]